MKSSNNVTYESGRDIESLSQHVSFHSLGGQCPYFHCLIVGKFLPVPPFCATVKTVVFLCPDKQMARVHATPIVARVTDNAPLRRILVVMKSPHYSMCSPKPVVDADIPVSARQRTSVPVPATSGFVYRVKIHSRSIAR